jgi:hypothetical protein
MSPSSALVTVVTTVIRGDVILASISTLACVACERRIALILSAVWSAQPVAARRPRRAVVHHLETPSRRRFTTVGGCR